MIPNHVSAKLSNLDLRFAESVPPGGNWRDIPESVPSERLAQIRVSAAAGEGSRSTYYGRLRPDLPAYTINTYYTRPGNGCFLHYAQDRTISHREAARLQSFPDDFVFEGSSQRALCQQIGNAVPPLLAFQVAQALGEPGAMVDVFAGAGGLSLGFEWAGWQSIAAVDSDKHAVATFNANIAPVAFVGDMTSEETHDHLVARAFERRGAGRLALVGGPPCQGFSTGGNRRSVDDARNDLHNRYAQLLARLRPDVFIFENVLGLLSIDKKRFLPRLIDGLRATGYDVAVWRLNAARFGVPQRRERVVLVGVPIGSTAPLPPQPWTSPVKSSELFALHPVCGTLDAIGDLPMITPGSDGSGLPYRTPPESEYQRLMRGSLSPAEYIARGRAKNDTGGRRGALRSVTEDVGRVHAG
ncbi:DNA (cytosine-5-)-methyltransferase [Afipia sp. DC4300-2b1]|uniref:DNA cytosine methyltransferase n=1 Tax=Afipia sp. DC4300-2b1 TaxID=2804672 RepID=UPI003CF7B61B